MPEAADLVLTDAEVHTMTDPDRVREAVAVRDGRIVRVDSAYEVDFLVGVETRVVDCAGGVVLPGFVDAHTHLPMVGRYLVHADLSGATGPDDAIERLRERAGDADGDDWLQGYGYDESTWDESRYLTREDLDEVSTERPVVAFREDMHVASVNAVALDRLGGDLPDEGVRTEGGEPTGVLHETAVDSVSSAVEPGLSETRELVRAAQARANELGVTCVHDMVRRSHAPRAYRDLAAAGDLSLRVRLNYWADHLDAVLETGLRTGHGDPMVRTGAIKTFTDGSFGGATARLREPYEDGDDRGGWADPASENRGEWVVGPEELAALVERADGAGLQVAAHAIGDDAIEAVLDAFEGTEGDRHRVEHAELLPDDLLARFREVGAVASCQPNFLKWAREGGLYADRIGDRRLETNRFGDLLDAGVPLAFGSDCMPLDPLFGVQQVVTAPTDGQRLSVTEALRAYTAGGAYAAYDEDELGTVEPGARADLVVLGSSPWGVAHDEIADIDVTYAVVDGELVDDARETGSGSGPGAA